MGPNVVYNFADEVVKISNGKGMFDYVAQHRNCK